MKYLAQILENLQVPFQHLPEIAMCNPILTFMYETCCLWHTYMFKLGIVFPNLLGRVCESL